MAIFRCGCRWLGGNGWADCGSIQPGLGPSRSDRAGSHAVERGGRQGRAAQAAHVGAGSDRRVGGECRFVEYAARRSGAADHGRGAHHWRGRQGRSWAVHGAGGRWPRAEGRVPALGEARQFDDRPALGFHFGSHARRARGRHRGQAWRPGAGQRRLGRVERPDRVRQPDGRQPHGPGPQHRRRDHRGRQWRLVQEDHGRRARRDFAAQGSHQHDGRSAALVRLGSDARGARSRHRRSPWRPGGGAGRRRHLEGSDRFRERHGDQPHGAGPQYRDGDHGRGARRSFAENHRRCEGRNSGAEGDHQHDGRSAQRLLVRSDPRGARGRHRRQAWRPGAGAGRRRHLEGSHRLGEFDGLKPHGSGPQHRRGDDRGRQGRSLAQDHGRCEGRNSRAEKHHQHDGRSAQWLRLGSDARGARSRHRRKARRPGAGGRRRRHVEGS